tara:strand:- start:83 stop:364 length:282 start_codon:yes stop_codon:yes gene_type:complete
MKRLWLILFLFLFQDCAVNANPPPFKSDFSVMTWNIWHGGREDGEKVGPQKIIKVIKNSVQISLQCKKHTDRENSFQKRLALTFSQGVRMFPS